MGHQMVNQTVVTKQDKLNPAQMTEKSSFFNEDGTPFTGDDWTTTPIVVATAAGTAAKTTSSPEPRVGSTIPIKFSGGQSASSPTVSFAGGTARAIHVGGVASAGAKLAIAADGIALFYFDGTILHQLGSYT